MPNVNVNYIDAQLIKIQNVPISDTSIKIKLHGENGETNWLSVDKVTAKAIEEALYLMAVRKDEAAT